MQELLDLAIEDPREGRRRTLRLTDQRSKRD